MTIPRRLRRGGSLQTITPPKKIQKSNFGTVGKYPIIDQSQDEIAGWTDDDDALIQFEKPVVVFGDHTLAVKYLEKPFAQGADGIKILETSDKLLPKFLYFLLKNQPIKSDGYTRHFSKLKRHKIPLPPLDVQNEIVEQIEAKENSIKHAKEIIKNLERERGYFGQTLRKLKDVEWVDLGNMCDIKTGKKDVNHSTPDGEYPFFTCAAGQYKSPDYAFNTEAILLPGNGANVGKVFYFEGKFQAYQRTYVLLNFKESILGKFLYHYLSAEWNEYIKSRQFGSATNYIVLGGLQKFKIPLPTLEIQKQLVAEAEKEEEIITANRRFIELMEGKIGQVLSEI